uniref:Serpin domain-containing protein n=1 Tax=Panagrolaimus davidi TaxID=227884 RepID=A0A914R407_9BILA
MSTKTEINFAIKFLNTLESCKKSTLFSPASILSSLAVIYAGSDELANQFGNLLGEEIDSMDFLKHYSKLFKFCQMSSNLNNLDLKILLLNRLYLSSQKQLHQDFIQVVAAKFSEDAFQQIDFSTMDMPKAKVAKVTFTFMK